MKKFKPNLAFKSAALAAAVLASATRFGLAQEFIVSSFDFDTDGWNYAFGVTGTATWDPNVDADGNANSGSLYYTADWANSPALFAWQDSNLQKNVSVVPGDYPMISYDIKVDGTNSALSAGGNYEGCSLVLRGNDVNATEVAQGQLNSSNTWIHVEAAVPANTTTQTWGMNIRFYPNPHDSNFVGAISYWIDNIKFFTPTSPPAPPTLKIEPAVPGLEVIASGSGQYQRQSIRTLDPNYTWVNSTTSVTYSVTIAKPPPPGSTNFGTYIFLIGTDNADPANNDADYSEPSGIFLEIQQQADGAYQGAVTYKTNAPNSHGIRYTTNGVLAFIDNQPGTGTWTLTLNQTNVTLSAPGGASTNGVLPADALPYFANVFAYFGVQPNDFAYINRSVTLGRARITGQDFAFSLDQLFTAQDTLDTNVWTIRAQDATGIQPHPTNTVYRLSWDLPATGFGLRSTPTLSSPSWSNPGLPAVSAGSRRLTFVPSTALPSAGSGFFRLEHP